MLPSLQRAFLADYMVIGGGFRLSGIDDVPTLGANRHEAPRFQGRSAWRLL